MAYNNKAKTKVLYLYKILQEETDAEHGLTMPQIIERLNEYGVSAERKSVYADIKALRDFDIDVRTYQRHPVEYAIERRDFSLGELMLLVDAVQSCHAITEKQAKMLITNIKTLVSNNERDKLDRYIHVSGRVKSKSDSVFGAVDMIHEAMRLRCKLEFVYRRRSGDGKFLSISKSKHHIVTPMGISYEDGFYYMTAWDEKHGDVAEYRLDRMAKLRYLLKELATRNEVTDNYRYEENKAVTFGRFNGNEVYATLSVDADKVEIITDKFGDMATFMEPEGELARVNVKICKSEQFFGWIAGLGKVVQIVSPDSLVKEYRDYLRFLLED